MSAFETASYLPERPGVGEDGTAVFERLVPVAPCRKTHDKRHLSSSLSPARPLLRQQQSTNPVALSECVRPCFQGFVVHVGRIYAGVVGR